MQIKFQGTGVALVTPFLPNGDIDFNALKKLVNHVVGGGVDYLVPLGSTGESVTLSEDERIALMEAVLETNDGRIPVLMGCGGNNTREIAEKMSKYTKRFAIHGFLSVSPAYNKPSQDGILAHYQALMFATDLPIMLYNVPGRTASNVLPATVAKLAALPAFVGVKEASGNVEQAIEILSHTRVGVSPINPAFGVYAGDDALALPMIAAGGDGLLSVLGNVFPAETAALVRAALDKDITRAQKLHYALYPYMKLTMQDGNPRSVKTMLENIGIGSRTVRLPLTPSGEPFARLVSELMARREPTKIPSMSVIEEKNFA